MLLLRSQMDVIYTTRGLSFNPNKTKRCTVSSVGHERVVFIVQQPLLSMMIYVRGSSSNF